MRKMKENRKKFKTGICNIIHWSGKNIHKINKKCKKYVKVGINIRILGYKKVLTKSLTHV